MEQDFMETVRVDENYENVFIGISSVIGSRNEQQDTVISDTSNDYINNNKCIAIVCDGMGGLSDGKKASSTCAQMIYEEFYQLDDEDDIFDFYKKMIYETDLKVSTYDNSGTTLVSVVIKQGKLYWASVGDSKIFIIRNNEIICVTNEHNYLMLLNNRVKRGEITQNEALSDPKKECLISFIGIGGVRYVDMNIAPFELMDGDCVVLCSDGLHRTISEQEIMDIVNRHKNNIYEAAEKLTQAALDKGKTHQDNTTAAVLCFQKKW